MLRGQSRRGSRHSRRQLPEGRNNRRRSSGAGFPRIGRIPGNAVRKSTSRTLFECLWGRAEKNTPLKHKTSFPGKEKRKRDAEKLFAPRISCSPLGRELAPAAGIYDPGSVAVASQGSSLSHSA